MSGFKDLEVLRLRTPALPADFLINSKAAGRRYAAFADRATSVGVDIAQTLAPTINARALGRYFAPHPPIDVRQTLGYGPWVEKHLPGVSLAARSCVRLVDKLGLLADGDTLERRGALLAAFTASSWCIRAVLAPSEVGMSEGPFPMAAFVSPQHVANLAAQYDALPYRELASVVRATWQEPEAATTYLDQLQANPRLTAAAVLSMNGTRAAAAAA